ncbi:MAG: hypothetical protein QM778_31660 [Myxococcales bacterium]
MLPPNASVRIDAVREQTWLPAVEHGTEIGHGVQAPRAHAQQQQPGQPDARRRMQGRQARADLDPDAVVMAALLVFHVEHRKLGGGPQWFAYHAPSRRLVHVRHAETAVHVELEPLEYTEVDLEVGCDQAIAVHTAPLHAANLAVNLQRARVVELQGGGLEARAEVTGSNATRQCCEHEAAQSPGARASDPAFGARRGTLANATQHGHGL